MFKTYIKKALDMSDQDIEQCLYLPTASFCSYYAILHSGHEMWSIEIDDEKNTFLISDVVLPSVRCFSATLDGKILYNPEGLDTQSVFEVLRHIQHVIEESRG